MDPIFACATSKEVRLKNRMKIASYNENLKIYLWLTLNFRKLLCILCLQRVYWNLCTTFNKLGHNLDHKKADCWIRLIVLNLRCYKKKGMGSSLPTSFSMESNWLSATYDRCFSAILEKNGICNYTISF